MSNALVANLIVQVGRRVRRGTPIDDAMRHTVAQYWQSIDPETVRSAERDAWDLMNEVVLERYGEARDITDIANHDELLQLVRSAQQKARDSY
ncbi:MAG: hypothetical protein OXC95_16770 [Dehalococcoidia bacterium]|nr:hypothetical protein [Dehalococcoidia bacterium]